MDSEFSGEENAFRRELEAFGDANRSGDVMDHNPEQLSQTVDRSAKRGLMADRQGVGGFGRGHHGAGGATQAGRERCALDGASNAPTATRWSTPSAVGRGDPENNIARRGPGPVKNF